MRGCSCTNRPTRLSSAGPACRSGRMFNADSVLPAPARADVSHRLSAWRWSSPKIWPQTLCNGERRWESRCTSASQRPFGHRVRGERCRRRRLLLAWISSGDVVLTSGPPGPNAITRTDEARSARRHHGPSLEGARAATAWPVGRQHGYACRHCGAISRRRPHGRRHSRHSIFLGIGRDDAGSVRVRCIRGCQPHQGDWHAACNRCPTRGHRENVSAGKLAHHHGGNRHRRDHYAGFTAQLHTCWNCPACRSSSSPAVQAHLDRRIAGRIGSCVTRFHCSAGRGNACRLIRRCLDRRFMGIRPLTESALSVAIVPSTIWTCAAHVVRAHCA